MTNPEPVVRSDDSIEYRSVTRFGGLKRADLLGEHDGIPNFELRKYLIEPGAAVGKHRNTIEHEQYILKGEYTIGIGESEFDVVEGDAVFIPADTVHWYRNETQELATYLCIVPIGDEGTEFIE